MHYPKKHEIIWYQGNYYEAMLDGRSGFEPDYAASKVWKKLTSTTSTRSRPDNELMIEEPDKKVIDDSSDNANSPSPAETSENFLTEDSDERDTFEE